MTMRPKIMLILAGVLASAIFLLGTPALISGAPALTNQTILPYASGGYKFQQVAWGAGVGFESRKFNDKAWATGTAGFSNTTPAPYCGVLPAATPWDVFTDMLVRHRFRLPPGATNVKVGVAIDNDVQVWVNGVDVSGGVRVHDFCATRDSFVFSVPAAAVHPGRNVLAVRGHDRGGLTYLDVQVTADVPVCQDECDDNDNGDLDSD